MTSSNDGVIFQKSLTTQGAVWTPLTTNFPIHYIKYTKTYSGGNPYDVKFRTDDRPTTVSFRPTTVSFRPLHVDSFSWVTRFGPKMGQIGPKWDKSGTFSDQI